MFIEFIFADLLIVQLAYLLFHDLVDLFPYNDIERIKSFKPKGKLVISVIGNSMPAVVALFFVVRYIGEYKPWFVTAYLVFYFSTTLLLIFLNWYLPYFFGASEKETADYEFLYGRTRQILPPRNGNPRPNALHVILHSLFVINTILMIFVAFNFV